MGATLTTNCKQLLENVLRENMEVFAGTRSGKTYVPQFVMENQLKIYPHAEPMAYKRRPMAPEGRLALEEKVFRWLKEGLIRKRMMEKVLADQRGQNVEIYLEEIVIKSKNELDLIQDVEETLRKLKRVNIKIDLVTSLFGVKEGRFLGCMVTKEGVKADPKKYRQSSKAPPQEETLDENEGRTLNLNKELQAKSTPTPRAGGLASFANQGLETIKLDFLNQEVSVGIKTRLSIEETSSSKKGKAASNPPGAKPNYNREASGSN
ncbi:hypothetical protein Tco_1570047 [Tanacetum coccineum]